MAKDLIIFSTQRSGTHVLASLLASHPQISGIGEIFHSTGGRFNFKKYIEGIHGPGQIRAFSRDLSRFRRVIRAILKFARIRAYPLNLSRFRGEFEGYLQSARDEVGGGSLCLILMYNQAAKLHRSVVSELFLNRGIIHLVRQNVLRTYVSNYINQNRLKPAHSHAGTETAVLTKIRLPTEALVTELTRRSAEIQRQREFVSRFDHVEVCYEDFDGDSFPVRNAAARFGFADFEASTRQRKSNPQTLKEILENFEDVQKTLKGTEFFAMTLT